MFDYIQQDTPHILLLLSSVPLAEALPFLWTCKYKNNNIRREHQAKVYEIRLAEMRLHLQHNKPLHIFAASAKFAMLRKMFDGHPTAGA